MSLTIELPPLKLPPEEETRFRAWAEEHGEAIQREAAVISGNRKPWEVLLSLFLKASQLLQPVLTKQRLMPGEYVRLLLQTMVALARTEEERTVARDVFQKRSALEDAMMLYRLEIVSLEIAAQIAGVSQRVFMDALGQAGISALQYSLEEALKEATAA